MISVWLVVASRILFFWVGFVHGHSVPAARAMRYGSIDSRQFMHFVVDLAWLNLAIIKGQKLQMVSGKTALLLT